MAGRYWQASLVVAGRAAAAMLLFLTDGQHEHFDLGTSMSACSPPPPIHANLRMFDT